MKIAISADCFSVFTSGYPVRGMTLALIKGNPNWNFPLLYTKRTRPNWVTGFLAEINSLPNVEVRYFKDGRRMIALKRMFMCRYVKLEDDFDCFLNPGNLEYIRGFKGLQICSLTDLSAFKGLSTGRYAFFNKYKSRLHFKVLLPKLTRIVTISEFTRKDLLEFYPHLADKTLCIHNGINPFWLDNHFADVDFKAMGIEAPYFIWWGWMSRRKNIYHLISAYKIAKSKHPELPKLLLVGKAEEYMSDITNEFDSDIINIPFQEDYTLKSLVRNSSGLIFPSLYEGFGLPVIEAFSQGVDVACSEVTSLPEVADGKAILFNPYDVESIEQAIIKLHQRKVDKQILMDYATKYNYMRAATDYMNLIKGLLK